MENQEQSTPTNIFSFLGVENPTPTPMSSGEEAPAFEPTPSGDGGEPAPSAETIINEDATFKASDLKAIFGDFESIDSIKQKYSTYE